MERWRNCVAVVTGASSGIGAAVVKDLLKAKENLIVVGLARRIDRMEQYKSELPADQQQRFHPIKCDISCLEAVNNAFDKIIAELGRVDILVNNASIFRMGQLCTIDVKIPEQILQTNVMGVVYCTQRAFKSMRERKFDGHVININSVVGHKIPSGGGRLPFMNMYGPSKFAVTAMTELYKQEFTGLGSRIKITSIGLTDTEMIPEEYRSDKYPRLRAEDISQCVLFSLATPPHMQINEITVEPTGAA